MSEHTPETESSSIALAALESSGAGWWRILDPQTAWWSPRMFDLFGRPREAGVPTRYVSGFAVMEIDRETGEARVRGTHAHAWCRAWDETSKSWIDVDLTPPDWAALEPDQASRFQQMRDWIQLRRENLLVWRDRPGNVKPQPELGDGGQ